MKNLAHGLIVVTPMLAFAATANAQTTPAAPPTLTGSVGCTAITQAAINGQTARVAADDVTINPPKSVKSLSCLDNFFSGIGLNLITNLLNPGNLLAAVEGQICNLVQQEWNNLLGGAQCGLTVTGFNLGFGGIGGGLSCPKLSFGGGGPPIATVGIGAGGVAGSGLYINGSGMAPTGYTVPNVPPGIL